MPSPNAVNARTYMYVTHTDSRRNGWYRYSAPLEPTNSGYEQELAATHASAGKRAQSTPQHATHRPSAFVRAAKTRSCTGECPLFSSGARSRAANRRTSRCMRSMNTANMWRTSAARDASTNSVNESLRFGREVRKPGYRRVRSHCQYVHSRAAIECVRQLNDSVMVDTVHAVAGAGGGW